MAKKLHKYTAAQLEFLRTGYPSMSLRELTRAFNAEFKLSRTEIQLHPAMANKAHKIRSGRTGCFEKGHRTWNAGTKGLTGKNRTTFKKGNVPPNRKPLGSERITKDGFIEIKIAEPDPYTGFPTRYKCKHVHVWEQTHGKVPHGMCMAFRDGNQLNCAPDNLMLISRAELLRLNHHGYKTINDGLKASLLALAKLEVRMFALARKRRTV